MQPELILTVEEELQERLDTYLSLILEDYSRSKVKTWCKAGLVRVNGQVRKGSFMLAGGEQLSVQIPEEREPSHLEPEDIPLDVIHEDEHIAVINKAAGMVVHPGAGIHSGTLANALAYRFKNLSGRGGSFRPGIVHRLDKGTTGLILVAKHDTAHKHLGDQWQAGTVTKVYQALVWGIPDPEQDEINAKIGRHPKLRYLMAADIPEGKSAKSRYKVVNVYPEASRLNVHILTGRTHQIRVHLAYRGHPVVGDSLYGGHRHRSLSKSFEAMPTHPMLHAAVLQFDHPESGERLTFKQPPPADFRACETALAIWPH